MVVNIDDRYWSNNTYLDINFFRPVSESNTSATFPLFYAIALEERYGVTSHDNESTPEHSHEFLI